MQPAKKSTAVVGARGHTGAELLRLLASHDTLEIVAAGSREKAGEKVSEVDGLEFSALDPGSLAAHDPAVVFLALPDGLSEPFVEALDPGTVIVDISSDHRFSSDWAYGLPELHRDEVSEARRIANPGCYATAMQLSVAPFLTALAGTPAVFGVSGYSGAGTTPGPRNDPQRLEDNLMPYKLVGHTHEREASFHLGHKVRFMPHVHPAFRGLLTTAHIPLNKPMTSSQAQELVHECYTSEPLIDIQTDAPELADGAGRAGVVIGGIEVAGDGESVVVVAAEDNLLKGAAVQALQNANLASGLPEFSGIL